MILTRNKKTALIIASEEGHRDIVEELLRHRQIDVNKIDSYGESALKKAAWRVSLRIVKLFLRCSETDLAEVLLTKKGRNLCFMSIVQGDTAGCTRSFIDINLEVAFTPHF